MDRRTIVPPPDLSIERVLADPAASFSLKIVLRAWRARDLVDAVLDARALNAVLEAELGRRLGRGV